MSPVQRDSAANPEPRCRPPACRIGHQALSRTAVGSVDLAGCPRARHTAVRAICAGSVTRAALESYNNMSHPPKRQIEYAPTMTRRFPVAHVLRVPPGAPTCDTFPQFSGSTYPDIASGSTKPKTCRSSSCPVRAPGKHKTWATRPATRRDSDPPTPELISLQGQYAEHLRVVQRGDLSDHPPTPTPLR